MTVDVPLKRRHFNDRKRGLAAGLSTIPHCVRSMVSRKGSAQDLMELWGEMLEQAQKATVVGAQDENNMSEGRSRAASRARSLIRESAMHIPQGDIPQK
eukprot:1153385-Pelagomonas_calceolata.AAC.2